MLRTQAELFSAIEAGRLDETLKAIYGSELDRHRPRFAALVGAYGAAFGESAQAALFSGPGRTELGGNHTDHQHGHVLAAAVVADAVCCAGPGGEAVIRVISPGYPDAAVELDDLFPKESERGTPAALVRGIAARASAMGFPVGGFNACVDSQVPGGSGLSSSAAFEVMLGNAVNALFCRCALSPAEIARMGQFAENNYFGKPCGLMDQMASAVGGIVAMDFRDLEQPGIRRLDFSLERAGYALCIVDTGGDHNGLTADYAAIPAEMHAVAAFFEKRFLREVDEAQFWENLPSLRSAVSDRAVLRAIHFFADDRMAQQEAEALASGDMARFLSLVRRSGISSAIRLQNLVIPGAVEKQAVPVVLAAAEHLLRGNGAVRVHGGGFAGTIQAYVPVGQKEAFRAGMEALLGRKCCRFVKFRSVGGTALSGGF